VAAIEELAPARRLGRVGNVIRRQQFPPDRAYLEPAVEPRRLLAYPRRIVAWGPSKRFALERG